MPDRKKEIVLVVAVHHKEDLETARSMMLKSVGVKLFEPLDGPVTCELFSPFDGSRLTYPGVSDYVDPVYSDIIKPKGDVETRRAVSFFAVGTANPTLAQIGDFLQKLINSSELTSSHVCCLIISEDDSVQFVSYGEGGLEKEGYSPSESRKKQEEVLSLGEGKTLKDYAEYIAWRHRLFDC